MKSMYRRIIVVASVFVLVIVTVASFFSIRITMQEEQGALCEQLMQAARYAARSAKKEEDLDHIAALRIGSPWEDLSAAPMRTPPTR